MLPHNTKRESIVCAVKPGDGQDPPRKKFGEEKRREIIGFSSEKKRREKKAELEGGQLVLVLVLVLDFPTPTRLKTGKNCKGSVAYFTRKKRN